VNRASDGRIAKPRPADKPWRRRFHHDIVEKLAKAK
jgi:hypothetical protein